MGPVDRHRDHPPAGPNTRLTTAPTARKGVTGAVDTVKKHVRHLPARLGVANHTEAVALARELSLIP
jgi:hypothetical protein